MTMSSQESQLRIPFGGKYCTSNHELVRFAAFITIGEILEAHSTIAPLTLINNRTSVAEHPDLKVFCAFV